MTPSVFDRANAVGKYAAKLIFDLQREYTAESGSNARSRARLARLRRDLDGTAPTWMSIGEELFAQWPQELEAPADDSPEFDRQVNAVKVALEYRECSERTGVEWDKRTYDHDDFDAGSEINKALSAANTCLYGLAHAAIVALGCSPGLGFVHVGHERSFVYDIADLYKAELSIPVAFETVAAKPEDIGSAVRHNIRDAIYDLSLMKRMTKDIRYLLGTSELEDDVFESDYVGLWDDKQGEVSAGKSYSDNDEWDGGTW